MLNTILDVLRQEWSCSFSWIIARNVKVLSQSKGSDGVGIDIKVIDNCFFIIKNVPDYTYQFENNKTDNNFEWLEYGMHGINFEKEYEIIKNNFDLSNLLNKEEV